MAYIKFYKGDVITTCMPFAHVLTLGMKMVRCDYCLKESKNLKSCGVCKEYAYCDRNCQKLDWSEGHKYECSIYAKDSVLSMMFPDDDDANRLCFRIYLKITNNLSLTTKKYKLHDGRERSFNDMMDHLEEIQKQGTLVALSSWMKEAFNHLRSSSSISLNPLLIQSIYGKIRTNAYEIGTDGQKHGSGLYIESSVFNHHCVSNAVRKFDGLKHMIYAKVNIREDEEIFIPYVDHNEFGSPQERKDQLRKDYFFDCDCCMCLLGDEKELQLKSKLMQLEEKRKVFWPKKTFATTDPNELKQEYEFYLMEAEVLPVSGEDPIEILTTLCMSRMHMLWSQSKDAKTDDIFLKHFKQLKESLNLEVDERSFNSDNHYKAFLAQNYLKATRAHTLFKNDGDH